MFEMGIMYSHLIPPCCMPHAAVALSLACYQFRHTEREGCGCTSVRRGGVVWEVRKGEGPVVEEEVECFLTNTRSAVGHNRENIL